MKCAFLVFCFVVLYLVIYRTFSVRAQMIMKGLKVGIIGGSGLSNLKIFSEVKERLVCNKYGNPSDVLLEGNINGVSCVLLPRHGRKHTISPSNINYRANIWALKQVGCTHVLSSTACGSLREEIKPGHFVILDQCIDWTKKRSMTFYDGAEGSPDGILHLSMGSPFCERTRQILLHACEKLNIDKHDKGTVVTIEGPRFSTKAESLMFRKLGGDVVNMTTIPEVILAKELGLSYAAIALATDFDSWHDSEEAVSADRVLEVMRKNSTNAVEVLKEAVVLIGSEDWEGTLQENLDNINKNLVLPS